LTPPNLFTIIKTQGGITLRVPEWSERKPPKFTLTGSQMPEDFFYQSDEDLLTDLLDYEFPKEELSKEEERLLASF